MSPVNPIRAGQHEGIQRSIKRSTDLRISGCHDRLDIDEALNKSLSHGLSLISGLYPFFKTNKLHDIGYNMQKTESGEFYHWHLDGGPGRFSKHQLVAIWYLNDCTESGGETQFYFQDLSICPQIGMLILFPPFWTHLHRGNTLQKGTKYIATTWICCE